MLHQKSDLSWSNGDIKYTRPTEPSWPTKEEMETDPSKTPRRWRQSPNPTGTTSDANNEQSRDKCQDGIRRNCFVFPYRDGKRIPTKSGPKRVFHHRRHQTITWPKTSGSQWMRRTSPRIPLKRHVSQEDIIGAIEQYEEPKWGHKFPWPSNLK